MKYDEILERVCAETEASYGPSDTLHCTASRTSLSLRDFRIGDLSAYDLFHPSYSGQAKIAAAAWRMSPWANLPLPADAPR